MVADEGCQCIRHPEDRGDVCELDPLGQKCDKIEFFVKKIDFCLMPARNQNLQQQGGG